MNPLHSVNFVSQGSVGSNALALLCLNIDEPSNTSIYHQLAICIAAICWFMLGYQPPDDYMGKGRVSQRDACNAFGKCNAASPCFHPLRANATLFLPKMVYLISLRSALNQRETTRCQMSNCDDIGLFFLIKSISDGRSCVFLNG